MTCGRLGGDQDEVEVQGMQKRVAVPPLLIQPSASQSVTTWM